MAKSYRPDAGKTSACLSEPDLQRNRSSRCSNALRCPHEFGQISAEPQQRSTALCCQMLSHSPQLCWGFFVFNLSFVLVRFETQKSQSTRKLLLPPLWGQRGAHRRCLVCLSQLTYNICIFKSLYPNACMLQEQENLKVAATAAKAEQPGLRGSRAGSALPGKHRHLAH